MDLQLRGTCKEKKCFFRSTNSKAQNGRYLCSSVVCATPSYIFPHGPCWQQVLRIFMKPINPMFSLIVPLQSTYLNMATIRSQNLLVILWWVIHSVDAIRNDSLAQNVSSPSTLLRSSATGMHSLVLLSTGTSSTIQQSEPLTDFASIALMSDRRSISNGENHSLFINVPVSTSHRVSSFQARPAPFSSPKASPISGSSSWTRPLKYSSSNFNYVSLNYVSQTTTSSSKPTAGIAFGNSSLSEPFNGTSNLTLSSTSRTPNTTFSVSVTRASLLSRSATSNTTCPMTSYAPNFPHKVLHLSGCDVQTSYVNDVYYYNYEDRCLASYCSASWFSAIDAYTGPIPTLTSTIPWMDIVFSEAVPISFGPLETLTISCT